MPEFMPELLSGIQVVVHLRTYLRIYAVIYAQTNVIIYARSFARSDPRNYATSWFRVHVKIIVRRHFRVVPQEAQDVVFETPL